MTKDINQILDELMPPPLTFTGTGQTTNNFTTYATITPPEANAQFNLWYSQHIVPLFTNAMVVHGYELTKPYWRFSNHKQPHNDTHKALLINLQLVKEDTVEGVLKELMHSLTLRDFCVDEVSDAYKKAWAFLEKSKK